MPRALILAPRRRSIVSSMPTTTGPSGAKAASRRCSRRSAAARPGQRFRSSTRWSSVKVGARPSPTTRSIAATVRRPGARMAPATRTSAWRQVGRVRPVMNGPIHAARGSGTCGWTVMAFVSQGPPGTTGGGRMADMSREEVLARYRHLRAISTRHHTEALRFLSRPALLEQARHLGLTAGEMLVAESMDEFTLVVDLAIHASRPERSRAIDRYAGAARLRPGSDEALVLEAMRRARFSVWRVERRHEVAGLVVQDLLRQDEAWLVDEAMERSASAGMAAAIRLCTPETFAMTSGVIVPVDREALEEVFDEVLPRVRGSPDQVANDRRFATAIYRTAVASGLMERIGFEEIPPPAR